MFLGFHKICCANQRFPIEKHCNIIEDAHDWSWRLRSSEPYIRLIVTPGDNNVLLQGFIFAVSLKLYTSQTIFPCTH